MKYVKLTLLLLLFFKSQGQENNYNLLGNENSCLYKKFQEFEKKYTVMKSLFDTVNNEVKYGSCKKTDNVRCKKNICQCMKSRDYDNIIWPNFYKFCNYLEIIKKNIIKDIEVIINDAKTLQDSCLAECSNSASSFITAPKEIGHIIFGYMQEKLSKKDLEQLNQLKTKFDTLYHFNIFLLMKYKI